MPHQSRKEGGGVRFEREVTREGFDPSSIPSESRSQKTKAVARTQRMETRCIRIRIQKGKVRIRPP